MAIQVTFWCVRDDEAELLAISIVEWTTLTFIRAP